MSKTLQKSHFCLHQRIIAAFAILTFLSNCILFPTKAQAQTLLNLPAPGTMMAPSMAYTPAIIAGMTIHPQNPLELDFLMDTGDDNLQGDNFQKEAQKMINYFLATLTVPDDEMWVNLSPYEKDRIMADGLSQTEMGRDMLIQDYILKQLTASLMYPEEELGETFWQKVYEQSYAKFGTTNIPANTFNKVWIVPKNASVYVNDTNVFVNESHLSVMLEEDYLALESNLDSTKHGLGNIPKDERQTMTQEAKEVVREIIIPVIEQEVNEGKNFANLRQIYHAMILATWYKKNLKQSILGHVYMDQNKVTGIDLEDKKLKEKIYQQYLEAFKKGVYDYVKEDYDPVSQEMIPRKYFSGGLKNTKNIHQDNFMSQNAIAHQWQEKSQQGIFPQKVELRLGLTGDDHFMVPKKPTVLYQFPEENKIAIATMIAHLNTHDIHNLWATPIILKIFQGELNEELVQEYMELAQIIANHFPQFKAVKVGRVIGLQYRGAFGFFKSAFVFPHTIASSVEVIREWLVESSDQEFYTDQDDGENISLSGGTKKIGPLDDFMNNDERRHLQQTTPIFDAALDRNALLKNLIADSRLGETLARQIENWFALIGFEDVPVKIIPKGVPPKIYYTVPRLGHDYALMIVIDQNISLGTIEQTMQNDDNWHNILKPIDTDLMPSDLKSFILPVKRHTPETTPDPKRWEEGNRQKFINFAVDQITTKVQELNIPNITITTVQSDLRQVLIDELNSVDESGDFGITIDIEDRIFLLTQTPGNHIIQPERFKIYFTYFESAKYASVDIALLINQEHEVLDTDTIEFTFPKNPFIVDEFMSKYNWQYYDEPPGDKGEYIGEYTDEINKNLHYEVYEYYTELSNKENGERWWVDTRDDHKDLATSDHPGDFLGTYSGGLFTTYFVYQNKTRKVILFGSSWRETTAEDLRKIDGFMSQDEMPGIKATEDNPDRQDLVRKFLEKFTMFLLKSRWTDPTGVAADFLFEDRHADNGYSPRIQAGPNVRGLTHFFHHEEGGLRQQTRMYFSADGKIEVTYTKNLGITLADEDGSAFYVKIPEGTYFIRATTPDGKDYEITKMPASTNIDNFMSTVPRPKLDNRINQQKMEAWIKSHKDTKTQDLARFLSQNITYIDQDAFESALAKTISDFNKTNNGDPYILLVPQNKGLRSEWWVYNLAKEKGLQPPDEIIFVGKKGGFQNDHSAHMNHLKSVGEQIKGSGIKNIVLMDDAVYSANLILSMPKNLFLAMKELGGSSNLNLHILAPFMTKKGEERILSSSEKYGYELNRIATYQYEEMQTVFDLLLDLEDDKISHIISLFGEKPIAATTLTYFQHKIPDHASFLKWVSHGHVVDGKGNIQKRITFIPKTTPPYEKDLFMSRQATEEATPLANDAKLAPGGIDFNPNNLDLKQQGQALNFQMDDFMHKNIQPHTVEGIVPTIMSITPITNVMPLINN